LAFPRIAGYEDVNDADRLGRDPAMDCRLSPRNAAGGLRQPDDKSWKFWGRSIMQLHRRFVLTGMATVLALPFALAVSPAGAADKIRIGFLLKTMQEERYQRDKAAFLARAKALGAEVIFDSANNDEQTQLAAFENMLSQGARVIVLQPVNTGTAGSMVTSAHKANVKVVAYDAMLVNGPLDAMVMQDSWAVGKLQADAMVAWLKAKNGSGNGSVKGNVALIRGQPGDSNANAMSSGVLEVLKANPDHRLVADQSHEGWLPDKAMATMENLLTKFGQQHRRRDLQQQRHGARRHRRPRRPGPGQRGEGFRRRLRRRPRQHPICRAGQGSRRNLEEDRPAR
jgi:ABC-type sugar transport system substrate-binding protein